ncbi:MAG: NADPH-dependent FMN reductase [Gemmatimonadaceae bacterium]
MADTLGPRALQVVGIAGSLRSGSWNRKLLTESVELAPPAIAIVPFDLVSIPLYDGDLDSDERRPEPVQRLKDAVSEASGVLFVSPEYNHSVPGVLQNTIDWISRPANKSPLAGKPVGLMGASRGLVGTARMQQVLKLTLLSTLARVMPHPGVAVSRVHEKFDESGRITDVATRDFVAAYLAQFAEWISKAGD